MSEDAECAERLSICALFAAVGKTDHLISDFLISGLCAMLLSLSVPAQAQQPTKVARIGYLSGSALSPLSRTAPMHSGKVCASLGTWRGKTLSLSGGARDGNRDRLSQRSQPS